MLLRVDPQGKVNCIYSELIDLASLGHLTIWRASYVEPDPWGQWWADLSPIHGPRLGPFRARSLALTAEQDWLEQQEAWSETS